MDRLSPEIGRSTWGIRVRRFADPSAVAAAAAEFVAETVRTVIGDKGRCRLALAGGNTPRSTYENLAEPELARTIDWSSVDVFFGDERMVPPDDSASNYRMAREALLDRVGVPAKNVHRMRGEMGAVEAAEAYVVELGTAPLDLVILGMGDDGHVASLFPGTRALENPENPVVPNESPLPPHSRVTLTMPVINRSERALLIVTGAGKAARLKDIFGELRSGRPVLPAARVRPASGTADWFVDAAAASMVDDVS